MEEGRVGRVLHHHDDLCRRRVVGGPKNICRHRDLSWNQQSPTDHHLHHRKTCDLLDHLGHRPQFEDRQDQPRDRWEAKHGDETPLESGLISVCAFPRRFSDMFACLTDPV